MNSGNTQSFVTQPVWIGIPISLAVMEQLSDERFTNEHKKA